MQKVKCLMVKKKIELNYLLTSLLLFQAQCLILQSFFQSLLKLNKGKSSQNMDCFHSPDDLFPVFRAINHIFSFCEQTGRSLKNFLTSFEVCCTEAQLEFKPITSQKDLLVLFLSPAMQAEIQHILFFVSFHLASPHCFQQGVGFIIPSPTKTVVMAYRHSN